jgi:ATP-binding cassette, subfamily B, bacterial MsbA
MKDLWPYFRYLKEVKFQFSLAMVCAVVYGLASGFGLPFMTHKVFPLIFHQEDKVEFYTELANGEFFPLKGGVSMVAEGFHVMNEKGDPTPTSMKITIQEEDIINEKGTDPPYLVNHQGSWIEVSGGIYSWDEGKGQFLTAGESDSHGQPSHWQLIGAVLMLPLVFLVRGASSFLNIYLISYCGMFVLEKIRAQVFFKLQQLPIDFFQKHKSGDIFNRLMGDTNVLQSSISSVANDIVKQPLTLIGGVAFLIYQSIQQEESVFILLCFAVIGLCIFPIRYIGKQLLNRVFRMQEQIGRVAAISSENLGAYREVRSFNLCEREEKRFLSAAKEYFTLNLKVARYSNGLNPMVELISATGLSFAIYYGAQKGITLNDIIPLIMALYLSYDPIKKMGNINSTLKTGMAALQRLRYILVQDDEAPCLEPLQSFPKSFSRLKFKNVDFSYEDDLVLAGINLEIQKGEIVALVGPSGAGKSTFASLISRFYDPKKGSLCLDEMDIRHVPKDELRSNVSLVSQDTFLFDDSVAGNLLLGNPLATEEELVEAAKKAQVHDFVMELPQGYQTVIGEKGTRLSGGQKQRMAIARAFLKQAPILVLDEATSALDSESEAKIQSALETLVHGKTVFIIAHRFSTIQLATRIIVFESGEVTGDGCHESLMNHHGLYTDLYRRQAGDLGG